MDTLFAILGWALILLGYLIFGLVMLFLWLLPFILIGIIALLVALFVRKLVLDAVREARRVERD